MLKLGDICNKWQAKFKISCWVSKVSGPPHVVGKLRLGFQLGALAGRCSNWCGALWIFAFLQSHGAILPGCFSTQRCRPTARCALGRCSNLWRSNGMAVHSISHQINVSRHEDHCKECWPKPNPRASSWQNTTCSWDSNVFWPDIVSELHQLAIYSWHNGDGDLYIHMSLHLWPEILKSPYRHWHNQFSIGTDPMIIPKDGAPVR